MQKPEIQANPCKTWVMAQKAALPNLKCFCLFWKNKKCLLLTKPSPHGMYRWFLSNATNVFVTGWNYLESELHPCTVNDLLDAWGVHLRGLSGGVINKRCLKEASIFICYWPLKTNVVLADISRELTYSTTSSPSFIPSFKAQLFIQCHCVVIIGLSSFWIWHWTRWNAQTLELRGGIN